jgi:hypothetical protein
LKTYAPFDGVWRITWMSGWDQEYVDMTVLGRISFCEDRSGSFQFGLVQGVLTAVPTDGRMRMSFTWVGADECEDESGRGYAEIVDDELQGHLYFHLGEDSAFRAIREPATVRSSARKRKPR